MVNSEQQLLRDAASEIGLRLSDQQLSQLLSYADLLEKWNGAFNLTAVRHRAELLSRHIVESLSIAPFLSGKYRADIGTGAGLPGIPLAITEPGVDYVLVDSNGKKTRFLEQVKSHLALNNVEIVQARVESFQPRALFDGVISRAFADLNRMCRVTHHLLAEGGLWFAMKSQTAESEILGLDSTFTLQQRIDLNVPFLSDARMLAVVKKGESKE